MPSIVAQFEVPGAHMVTLAKAPFTIPAGFCVLPPAVIANTLFAGPVIGLLPVVLLLLAPQPAANIAAPIKTKNNHLGTEPPSMIRLLDYLTTSEVTPSGIIPGR
jgi:hypothetical protein